jgi:hypothetical protein
LLSLHLLPLLLLLLLLLLLCTWGHGLPLRADRQPPED